MPGHGHRPGAVHHDLRLADRRSRLDVHAVLRACSASRRRSGAAGSSAQVRARRASSRRCCWCGGLLISAHRRDLAPALADVARLRRDRRHRPRARLHLAGVDADQMVPRSARHGDRHGDHGLRRRRDDRRAARQSADEPLPHATHRSACGRPSSRWRRSISSSCWAARSAIACRHRLEARGLDARRRQRRADRDAPGASARRAQDARSSG